MKYILAGLLLLFPFTASAQIVGVTSESDLDALYICDIDDASDCFLLLSDGRIVTRRAPTGRGAIDWDMQNWQFSKDQIMALPGGAERDKWEQDAVYWQVRLLADKAYARLAASVVPPLFGIISSPEHSEPIVEAYRAQYAKATRLVIIMEEFFNLPHHGPVGVP